MTEREEKFEKMMQSVLDSYDFTVEKMDKLRQEGKTNTVTYKQLMAEKLKKQKKRETLEVEHSKPHK